MSKPIVVDTSIVISALIGETGASRQVLRQCLLGFYTPLISNALFQEYEDVCFRKRVTNASPLNPDEIRDLLNSFYGICLWTEIYYLWRPNLGDEDDNFLVELAVAGNCDTIITNNIKDLKDAELAFNDLKILKPEQLLRGD